MSILHNIKSVADRILNITAALPVIYLVIGLILGGICFIPNFQTNYPTIYQVLWTAAGIVLVSALVSFLMASARYMGVFRDALEEIIYDPKFLNNRKDIEDVWEKVSFAMFNSKLPTISNRFLKALKNYYMVAADDQFYNDYRAIIEIQWLDKDTEWVKIIYKVDFTLVTESDKDKIFSFKSWTNVTEDSKDFKTETKILKYEVDGIKKDVSPSQVDVKNGEKIEAFEVQIGGRKEYKIRQELEKTMCLKDDNFCAFNCKWLVNNMDIQVYYPENMRVNFLSKGTAKEFNEVDSRPKSLRYEYKGLILRSQGYLFILTKQ